MRGKASIEVRAVNQIASWKLSGGEVIILLGVF